MYETEKKIIIDTVKKYLQLCDDTFGKHYKIQFNPSRPLTVNFYEKGSNGGVCVTNTNANGTCYYELRFNILLASKNMEHYINDVVPHELSHYVKARITRNGTSHDSTWKSIMRRLGCVPNVYHNMDLSQVNDNYVMYKCTCGNQLSVTKLKAKKMVQSKSEYMCTKCRSNIDKTKLTLLIR